MKYTIMAKSYLTMDDFDLTDKTVFLRLDINSPIDPKTGDIMDYSRFKAHLDTIRALDHSKVVIIAHQSRPGKKDFTPLYQHSLALAKLLKRDIKYIDGLFDSRVIEEIKKLIPGDILMLENTRFFSEEVVLADEPLEIQKKSNIVRKLAPHMDYLVNDAFAAVHRPQPTLVAFAEEVPMLAGKLMDREISMLNKFMEYDAHPKIALFAGAKADDSIKVSKNMLEHKIVDKILTGGLVANVFLIAKGVDIGPTNLEILTKEIGNYQKLVDMAKQILKNYEVITPTDFAVNKDGKRVEIGIDELGDSRQIMDIGIDTIESYKDIIKDAKSIILNGPLGVYELPEFSDGTEEIFRAISTLPAFKVVGGGHTISAISKMGLNRKFDHISVGGGALISFLAGEDMPVIEALKRSKLKFEKKVVGK